MTETLRPELARVWRCGDFALPLGEKTLVMAILNVTPDSFSGDGFLGAQSSHRVLDSTVQRALQAIEDGADILDIGGESTRPGASEISLEEETRRVVPLIEKLAAQIQVPISVDTTKSQLARRALDAGASLINDISGATHDAQMLPLLAKSRCGIVLMHRRGTPQTMRASEKATSEKAVEKASSAEDSSPKNSVAAGKAAGEVGESEVAKNPMVTNLTAKNDIISQVLDFWRARIEAAQKLGIAPERIALDAGFGFGKSLEENLKIVRRGRELSDFGFENFRFPTLSGTSRKSTIGRVLHRVLDGEKIEAPIEERAWGTAATVALAIANGAEIVRVHDVREMAQVARMTDAIVRA